MCRHLAYLGPPLRPEELVLAPPHSLLVQSHAARELLRGSVCADGFGVGWYADGEPEPAVYRRESPIWADPDLPRVARAVRSPVRRRLGAQRHPGRARRSRRGPADAARRVPFAHNGAVAGFAELARALREGLPDDLYAAARGAGDSEALFLLVLAAVRAAGGDLAAGVRAALAEVAERAPGSGLNVVLTDGRTLVATAAGRRRAGRLPLPARAPGRRLGDRLGGPRRRPGLAPRCPRATWSCWAPTAVRRLVEA